MDAEAILESCRIEVEARLDVLLPSETAEPQPLHRAMRYAALAGGKRLRPALCLASAKAVGGEGKEALDAACAVELVHTFSLIHDDLPAIDDDPMRRGRPSVHVEFGQALAILAGDALFAHAFQVMANCSVYPNTNARAVRILAEAAGSSGLVGGEVMDVLAEGSSVTEETVRDIHSRKTAALISASCVLGGLLGSAGERQLGALKEFGWNVGFAFQITDDVLNETSTARELGKSTGSDKARSKATFPSVVGVESSRAVASQAVEHALVILRDAEMSSTELEALAGYAIYRFN